MQTLKRIVAAAVLGGLVFAGSLLAQFPGGDAVAPRFTYDEAPRGVFGAAWADWPPVTVSFELDGEQIVARFDGAAVEVTADGEALPAERLERASISGYRLGQPLPGLTEPGGSIVGLKDANGNSIAMLRASGRGISVRFVPKVQRAWLGIDVGPLDPALAEHIRGLKQDAGKCGVIVAVHPDSPAAKAGLKPNDILTSIDSVPGAASDDIQKAVRERKPGERMGLIGLRQGETFDRVVELGRAPTSTLVRYLPSGEPDFFLGSQGADEQTTFYRWPNGTDARGFGQFVWPEQTPAGEPAESKNIPVAPYFNGRGTGGTFLWEPQDVEQAKRLKDQLEALQAAIERIEKQLAERREN